MDKKRPYTFLFRKGVDQTLASPQAKPAARSGKRAAAKKPAMRSIGFESVVRAEVETPSAAAAKRIGVLDIDVYAGFLFRVLTAINKRQKMFEFHQIEATTPVGLTRSGERMSQR